VRKGEGDDKHDDEAEKFFLVSAASVRESAMRASRTPTPNSILASNGSVNPRGLMDTNPRSLMDTSDFANPLRGSAKFGINDED